MNWLSVVCCVALGSATVASTIENASIPISKDIILFYENMQREFKQPSDERTAVILVGNTGCGKSSLAHYIAGDIRKLKSVPASNNVDETNFLVEDLYDKISGGSSTTESKTIIPERITDESGGVWYDCPGFSDTRNSSVEITITYFLKSVTDKIQNIKILFVVNYSSLARGMYRADFDDMVNHGIKLIRNIDKYKLSLGLVVTKVESVKVLRRKPIQISENSIVDSVGEFLTEYKLKLEKSAGTEDKRKFVDALLRKSVDGNFTQIGVFWRPDDKGPFDQLSLMVVGRNSLRNLVADRMKYVPVSKNDFGYTLSEKAENDITEAREELIKEISDLFKVIEGKIKKFYAEQQLKLDYFADRVRIIENAEEKFLKLKLQFNSSMPIELFGALRNITSDLKIPNLSEEFGKIMNNQIYLHFLQTVSSSKIELSSTDWALILRDCFDYIQQEKNWNVFLLELFTKLSSYTVQRDRTRFNVATVSA